MHDIEARRGQRGRHLRSKTGKGSVDSHSHVAAWIVYCVIGVVGLSASFIWYYCKGNKSGGNPAGTSEWDAAPALADLEAIEAEKDVSQTWLPKRRELLKKLKHVGPRSAEEMRPNLMASYRYAATDVLDLVDTLTIPAWDELWQATGLPISRKKWLLELARWDCRKRILTVDSDARRTGVTLAMPKPPPSTDEEPWDGEIALQSLRQILEESWQVLPVDKDLQRQQIGEKLVRLLGMPTTELFQELNIEAQKRDFRIPLPNFSRAQLAAAQKAVTLLRTSNNTFTRVFCRNLIISKDVVDILGDKFCDNFFRYALHKAKDAITELFMGLSSENSPEL